MDTLNIGDKMKIALIYAVLIEITLIVCFTVLAIHFNKWWIVLFIALFTPHIKFDKENEEVE